MFSGLMSPDLPNGFKSGDYIKASDKLGDVCSDTDANARAAVVDATIAADVSTVFWYTKNARRITVYAWTKAGISSCVMQPGHVGKAVAFVPKNAKPIGFPCVASMIIRSSPESTQGPSIQEPQTVKWFFPTICDNEFLDALQDCVEATWLSKLKDGGFAFSHPGIIERAEQLAAKMDELNWLEDSALSLRTE